MQGVTSEKTFHLKWNNHLQNLSQLFTAIYSSSALADVTLSCRDGAIRAHKLVLSACSPYFEQIFRDNPCKHPVIILKGIPYAEINLLVEFMYKGSVDVQEIDLQSLMHTASELEVRGLAYELRKDASSLLNINLNEYPTSYNSSQAQENLYGSGDSHPSASFENTDRLQQIHMYQQSMLKNAAFNQNQAEKRKRKDDPMPPNTATAVKNILAAAAKELEEKKSSNGKSKVADDETSDMNAEMYESDSGETEMADNEELPHGRDTRFKGKKRVSVGINDDYTPTVPRILSKSKQAKKNVKLTIKAPDPANSTSGDCEDAISKVIISAVTGGVAVKQSNQGSTGTLKCVSFNDLRETRDDNVTVIEDDDSSAVDTSDENNLLVETAYESAPGQEDEYDSSDSKPGPGPKLDNKIYKCDLCGLSYGRKFHMTRHRQIHTGERPFQCIDCPFSFSRSSHLARHRRTHTGERPYRCEACGRTFTRGDKLKLHLRICEKDEYVLPSRPNAEDPASLNKQVKKETSGQTMIPGMVSMGHSERHQLMFTSSGDVLLAPRSQSDSMVDLNSSAMSELSESNQSSLMLGDLSSKMNLSILGTPSTSDSSLLGNHYLDASGYPIKRGRGRPRKKPLPLVMPLIKKKRGRPPKIIKLDPSDGSSNKPVENYNVSNLPYGDFSYLTDILSTNYAQAYQNMIQINPMMDSAKFVNLMTTAVAQSTPGIMIATANPIVATAGNKLPTQELKPILLMKQQTPESTATDTSKSIESTNTNDSSKSNNTEMAVTDLTSDKEEVGDNAVETNLTSNDDSVQIPVKVGDCTVSKVPNTTLKEVNEVANISTAGECTIEPVKEDE